MSGTSHSHKKPKMKTTNIPPKHIAWLKGLVEYPFELGGSINFNKRGQVDHFTVYTGKTAYVELPDAFQIEWHSHPRGSFVELPSVTDLRAAMKRKLEVGDFKGELSLVVGHHGIVTYSYTRKLGLNREEFKQIANILQRGTDTVKGLQKQIAQIKLYGFDIKLTTWQNMFKIEKSALGEPKISGKGLSLNFCFRKYVTDPLA